MMTPRKKPEEFKRRPIEHRTLEEIAKEKERIRKLKKTLSEQNEGGQHYKAMESDNYDPLLEALIKEHPEKDPAKIK